MNRVLLRQELERDEGLRTVAYKDSLGYWTIGIGHLLGKSPRMSSVTEDEVQALYEFDVAAAERLAREVIPLFETLSDARQRAMVNLCFNLGLGVRDFKRFIAAVVAENWLLAGKELEDSHWWGQVGLRGPRIRAMIENG